MIPRVKIMVAIDSACPKLVITSLKLIAKMSFSGRKFGAKLKNPKNRIVFLHTHIHGCGTLTRGEEGEIEMNDKIIEI